MNNVKNSLENYILKEDERDELPKIINRLPCITKNISELKEEIFTKEKFRYKKSGHNFFQNMEKREGDCLDFSLLYHFILNRMNIHNNIVSAKGHTMISFSSSSYLLETTEGTFKFPEKYIEKRKIPVSSIRRGIYLSALNDKDVFALYLNKKSKPFVERGEFSKALKYLDRSLDFSKRIPEVSHNKGFLLNKLESFGEAIKYFNNALDLDPQFYEAMNNLGISHAKLGNEKEAEKYFEKVYRESEDPERKKAAKNLEILKSI